MMQHLLRALVFVSAVIAAPILAPRQGAEVIAGQYIVVLKDSASKSLLESTASSVTNILDGIPPKHTFNIGSFKAFTVTADEAASQAISKLADVDYIEPDTRVSINALTTQSNPPWGLARISHRDNGATEYVYDDSAGEGTYAYIIDTGIFTEHSDFGGRASWGINLAGDGSDEDGNGHGTHVAGTTGGTTYGVAKKTSLIAVKVLDSSGSGSTSQVIAGIQWAADDANTKGRVGKAVANLSLGGILSTTTNRAAAAAVKAGLFLAVAAGNDGLPAELFSPASEPTVCTVGATDDTDARASFSNFGRVVDIFAPGVDVLSAWNNGTDETNIISGTSMATPHITGLGAYLLALEGPRDPEALCARIEELSTKGKISNPGLLTKNQLAFNGATE